MLLNNLTTIKQQSHLNLSQFDLHIDSPFALDDDMTALNTAGMGVLGGNGVTNSDGVLLDGMLLDEHFLMDDSRLYASANQAGMFTAQAVQMPQVDVAGTRSSALAESSQNTSSESDAEEFFHEGQVNFYGNLTTLSSGIESLSAEAVTLETAGPTIPSLSFSSGDHFLSDSKDFSDSGVQTFTPNTPTVNTPTVTIPTGSLTPSVTTPSVSTSPTVDTKPEVNEPVIKPEIELPQVVELTAYRIIEGEDLATEIDSFEAQFFYTATEGEITFKDGLPVLNGHIQEIFESLPPGKVLNVEVSLPNGEKLNLSLVGTHANDDHIVFGSTSYCSETGSYSFTSANALDKDIIGLVDKNGNSVTNLLDLPEYSLSSSSSFVGSQIAHRGEIFNSFDFGEGNDNITLSLKGDAQDVNTGIVMGEGNDIISISGIGRNTVFVTGDEHLLDGKAGGNDTIVINHSESFGLAVNGDALSTRFSNLGDDLIRLNSIYLDEEKSEGFVNGDAHVMTSSTGGADSISVGYASVSGTNALGYINGDAYKMVDSQGGDDRIEIHSLSMDNTSSRLYVNGDAHTLENSKGGNDYIKIGLDNTEAKGGFQYFTGDAYTLNNSIGGDDTIVLNGLSITNQSSSFVGGDGHQVYSTVCGNDSIVVENKMEIGFLAGDGYSLYDGSQAGDDTINVNNLTGGTITGDSFFLQNSYGGNDLIMVDTVNGGAIYGDARSLQNSTGGDDTIIVNKIEYVGNNITIDGNDGNDLFIYNNDQSHKITLQEDGTVDIFRWFNHSGGIGEQVTSNASIRNFEGIGGGSGHDFLEGNSGDNIIIGGKGSDSMTGGGGNDTFLFRLDDFDNGVTDSISDFSKGDMLDLTALKENGYTFEATQDRYDNVEIIINNATKTESQKVIMKVEQIDDFDCQNMVAQLNNSGMFAFG